MRSILFFVFIAIFLRRNLAEIVKIDQGLLNGTVLRSRNGTPYQAFYDIPYAAPPVGQLRFKPPAESLPWTGVRQAVAKGSKCIQDSAFNVTISKMVGTEDCLYLNVFTRELKPKKLLPVMVYIHGGAFCMGDGNTDDVHPLMDKSLVVVTINYRLGIFGLFSSADDVIPGNFGLKDQTASLKWIQKNIGYFGGDPKSVTIFGQSSGSVNIHMHLMSPLSKGKEIDTQNNNEVIECVIKMTIRKKRLNDRSKLQSVSSPSCQGLFHKAIMESGSGRSLWAYYNKRHNKEVYLDTIKRTNCTSTSSLENLRCLQKLPAKYLWKLENDIKIDETLVLKYRPVIENASQPGAFLTKDPHRASYQNSSIPVIMGFNSAEGILDSFPFLLLYPNRTLLDKNLDVIIPQKLHYFYTTSPKKQKYITKMIKNFYFFDGVMTKGQEQNFCNIMSDIIFIMPIIDAIKHYPGPKYAYMYDYRNAVSTAYMFNVTQEDLGIHGACHKDELLSLLYSEYFSPKLSKNDIKFSQKFVSYWTNFAYSGNPNKHEKVPEYWNTAVAGSIKFLYLSNKKITMKTEPLRKRHDFWLKCPLSHQYGK